MRIDIPDTPYRDVWIVIPAFNEATVIADVVTDVRAMFPNVVCVDDGSADDTLFKEFFESMFKYGHGGQGSTVRRDGSVVKKHFGTEVFRVAFYGAWVKSSAFGDLEAGSTTLLKQTVVLEHDGLELILPS